MNDEADTPSRGELIMPDKLGGAIEVGTGFGGLNIQSMGEVIDMAKLMATSGKAVPEHLRGNPGMCWAICLSAIEWKMSPIAIANKTYVTNDRLNYESQLVHAVIEARAPLKERLKARYEGEGDDRVCIVYGTFRGETEPREHRSPRLGDVRPPHGDKKDAAGKPIRKGSPLWDKKPDVQLFYDTSRDFCRIYCPDVLLGIYTPDEVEQYGIGEGATDVTAGAALHERLKSAARSEEGFQDGAVERGLNGGDANVSRETMPPKATGEPASAPAVDALPIQGAEASSEPAKPGRRRPATKAKAGPNDAIDEGYARAQAEADTKGRESTRPSVPTTIAQYREHVEAYVAGATEPEGLDLAWRCEKALRGKLGIIGPDFDHTYGLVQAKLAELRGG